MKETLHVSQTYYVAGTSLMDARSRAEEFPHQRKDTAQEAYDNVDYFDKQDYTFEVYRFQTTAIVESVNPPYTER